MLTTSLCFSESVYKTCQRQPTELKLGKMVAHSKFHKICKFENHVTRNDVIMTSLPKTMEKCGTSAKPNKLYINRKVSMRDIQKCTFNWIWATMSKVMGIYVKFWHFLRCPLSKYGHVTWPKKQISKKIYFFLILHLILGKFTKFLVEKLSTSEVINQKPHGGVENSSAQCYQPSAFRVNVSVNSKPDHPPGDPRDSHSLVAPGVRFSLLCLARGSAPGGLKSK